MDRKPAPNHPSKDSPDAGETPLTGFSRCHEGILTQLQALSGLPALVTAAAQAREVAADSLALFDDAVLEHHADEEKELFPAVLRHAAPGAEQSRMKALVDRLTADHREIEALWKTQKAAVDAAARGKPSKLDANAVHHLVASYAAHARLEESEFLPLAQEILGRSSDRMASLGMSLHMRHAPRIPGYI